MVNASVHVLTFADDSRYEQVFKCFIRDHAGKVIRRDMILPPAGCGKPGRAWHACRGKNLVEMVVYLQKLHRDSVTKTLYGLRMFEGVNEKLLRIPEPGNRVTSYVQVGITDNELPLSGLDQSLSHFHQLAEVEGILV